MKEYGSRVFAIHLHDNCGEKDSHLVPFDGEIDWRQKSKQIADSSYTGSITIESEYNVSAQYRRYELTDFLSSAFASDTFADMLAPIHVKRENCLRL